MDTTLFLSCIGYCLFSCILSLLILTCFRITSNAMRLQIILIHRRSSFLKLHNFPYYLFIYVFAQLSTRSFTHFFSFSPPFYRFYLNFFFATPTYDNSITFLCVCVEHEYCIFYIVRTQERDDECWLAGWYSVLFFLKCGKFFIWNVSLFVEGDGS